MEISVDGAGRIVIPKTLRDRIGLAVPATLTVEVDGAGIRLEPVSDEFVRSVDGRLVVPKTGTPIDDELVIALRDADRR